MDITSVYNQFSEAAHRVFRRALALGSGRGVVHTTDLLRAVVEVAPEVCRQAIPSLVFGPGDPVATIPVSTGQDMGPRPRLPLSNSPSLRAVLFRAAALASEQPGSHRIDPACLLTALLEDPRDEIAGWCRLWGASPVEAARRTGHRLVPPALEKSAAEPRVISPTPVVSLATPVLDEIGIDLTCLAREGRVAEPIGREELLQALCRALLCRDRQNVFILGPAGVGKTALVHGLAVRLVRGRVPSRLRGLRIIATKLI